MFDHLISQADVERFLGTVLLSDLNSDTLCFLSCRVSHLMRNNIVAYSYYSHIRKLIKKQLDEKLNRFLDMTD